MTATIVGVVMILLALGLLLARVPIMVALGLPALLASLIVGGLGSLSTLGLDLIAPFNLYTFGGVILWAAIGAILNESGLMQRYLTALHIIFGRQVTPARQEAWANGVHGLAMTTVSLLLVAGLKSYVDGHFLLLQMLLLLTLIALVGGAAIVFSAPRISSMTLKKMQSKDGQAWKQTAKASAEVTEDGRTKRLTSKSTAFLTLLLPLILVVFSLLMALLTPADLTDLGGLVWIVVSVAAVAHNGIKWLADAGVRAVLTVAYIASTVAGAWWFAEALDRVGFLPRIGAPGGNTVLWILVGGLVASLVFGKVIGPEAGALLAVSIFSPLMAAPYDTTATNQLLQAVSALLTSFLVCSTILGAVLARVLPPKDSPWPLMPTPVTQN